MPKYNNPRRTWKYTDEFKYKAVRLSYMEGVMVKDVSEALDIHPFMLSRWRKEVREGIIVVKKSKKSVSIKKETVEIKRVKELEKKVARLEKENDLLKKWQRYLAEQHQENLDLSKNTDKS